MTRKTSTNSRRHPVADKPHLLLTGAEARGEAAYMVLERLLPKLSQSMCKRIMAEAYLAADDLDIDAIKEEVESLFADIVFESPTR